MTASDFNPQVIIEFVKNKFATISAEMLGWLAIVVLHSATVPTLIAVWTGLSDKLPGIDMVLLMWAGLVLFFIKAAIQKDMLNLVTIGLGFIVQASLMALIFFK